MEEVYPDLSGRPTAVQGNRPRKCRFREPFENGYLTGIDDLMICSHWFADYLCKHLRRFSGEKLIETNNAGLISRRFKRRRISDRYGARLFAQFVAYIDLPALKGLSLYSAELQLYVMRGRIRELFEPDREIRKDLYFAIPVQPRLRSFCHPKRTAAFFAALPTAFSRHTILMPSLIVHRI